MLVFVADLELAGKRVCSLWPKCSNRNLIDHVNMFCIGSAFSKIIELMFIMIQTLFFSLINRIRNNK